MQLTTPAFRGLRGYELVKRVLHLLSKRAWTDEAESKLEVFEHSFVCLLQQTRAKIEPTGVRSVARIGWTEFSIFGSEDALAEKQRFLTVAPRSENWREAPQEIERTIPESWCSYRVEVGDAQALCVVLIRVEEETVVFLKDSDALLVLASRRVLDPDECTSDNRCRETQSQKKPCSLSGHEHSALN